MSWLLEGLEGPDQPLERLQDLWISWDLFVYSSPGARHLEKVAAGRTRGSENCQRQMSRGYWEVCVCVRVSVCLSVRKGVRKSNWSRAVSLRNSYIQLPVTGEFGDPSASYCTDKCLRLVVGYAPWTYTYMYNYMYIKLDKSPLVGIPYTKRPSNWSVRDTKQRRTGWCHWGCWCLCKYSMCV